jgi:HEPN domain-containing protein
MPREESLYPADWIRVAEKDLERVGRLLDAQDPEAAGFFLQQAVEKFFKAFLLAKGWQLRRTYDLEALLNEALAYAPSFCEKSCR